MEISMKKDKIRKLVRNILPYKIVVTKKRNGFWDDALKVTENPKTDAECMFANIVSVEGFGATGSSAVIDLIREYKDMAVLGTVDPEGSQTSPKEAHAEIDILRQTGGLYQMERCFDKNIPQSYFWNDAAVKQFLDLAYFSPFYRGYPAMQPYFHSFARDILTHRVANAEGSPVNHLMGRFYDASDIYYLNSLTIKEYQEKDKRVKLYPMLKKGGCGCAGVEEGFKHITGDYFLILTQDDYIDKDMYCCFLKSIFNYFYTGKSTFLVLDQLFAGCEIDVEHFRKYVPNLKQIMVYRDPRDVYCICQRLDLSWMPHETVERYIEWVKMAYGNFEIDSTDYATLRFEDMVLDYDNTVCRIEKFLGLSPEQHVRPKSCFNPAVSEKSVGEWKREPQFADDFKKIKEALPHLCYEK